MYAMSCGSKRGRVHSNSTPLICYKFDNHRCSICVVSFATGILKISEQTFAFAVRDRKMLDDFNLFTDGIKRS